MILNQIGTVAQFYLKEIPKHFSNVEIDEMVIMPNHIHCILLLKPTLTNDSLVGTSHVMSLPDVMSLPPINPFTMEQPPTLPEIPGPPSLPRFLGQQPMKFQFNKFSKPVSGSIAVIIQQFKYMVTRWCNENGYKYFKWHPRFHDQVIRDHESYLRIKKYIIDNPKNWKEDSFNKKFTRK